LGKYETTGETGIFMRSILHVDMDAFYASVEQFDHPEYKGRPVIVGADPRDGLGRGVVAACSYEARKFGVRSALPISRAWKLCPEGVYVRPRMERYVEVSRQVMEVFRRYTDLVEPLSIDEAFLDITGSTALLGTPEHIARSIKKEIREATTLNASVGLAPNKFLAKIASDLKKPDAFVVVEEKDVDAFLRDLPISRLWGVGPKTEERLHEVGYHTIGQLAAAGRDRLVLSLGSLGEHLYQLSQGKDDRPVVPDGQPKSISSETTFDVDTGDRELLLQTILELSDYVAERLRKNGYRARKITLKLRYSNFSTHTKQSSQEKLIQTGEEIAAIARYLFCQFPLNRKIRLLGVAAGDLHREGADPQQLTLFGQPNQSQNEKLSHTVDEIKLKFGNDAIRRASQL
jgi:nucleotidyltransferase/DNA polymerase involved in DNA repair